MAHYVYGAWARAGSERAQPGGEAITKVERGSSRLGEIRAHVSMHAEPRHRHHWLGHVPRLARPHEQLTAHPEDPARLAAADMAGPGRQCLEAMGTSLTSGRPRGT